MQNDLISRDFTVKALREYAEQKHAGGEVELANGILKAVCFLEKKENVPTAYDVEKVVAELEERSYQEAVDDMDAFGDIPSTVVSLKTATRIVRNGGKE